MREKEKERETEKRRRESIGKCEKSQWCASADPVTDSYCVISFLFSILQPLNPYSFLISFFCLSSLYIRSRKFDQDIKRHKYDLLMVIQ